MATGGAEVEAHVVGHPKGGVQEGNEGQLGACPFSHRVLLILEEKQVPYKVNYVDVQNKPAWVSKVNPAGTLPVIKDLGLDSWVVDSDTISDYLEDKYAPPAGTADEDVGGAAARRRLGKVTDVPHPGADLYPKFMAFLKAGGTEGGKERQELEQQLQTINDSLSNDHPYMGGHDVNAWDMALAPRLHFARVGCKALKGWDFAEAYPEVRDYLHRITGRPAWRNTASYDEESIVEDLKAKLARG